MLLMINILFMFVPYWIFVGMSPLLYRNELGVSLAHFGYYQGVLALVFAAGSVIYGFMIKYYDHDYRTMLKITALIYVVSMVMLGLAANMHSKSAVFITLGMTIFVVGQIIPSTILYPICLNYLPSAKGKVSAIMQAGRLMLSAVGLQLASHFYEGTFQPIGNIIVACIFIATIMLVFINQKARLLESGSYDQVKN